MRLAQAAARGGCHCAVRGPQLARTLAYCTSPRFRARMLNHRQGASGPGSIRSFAQFDLETTFFDRELRNPCRKGLPESGVGAELLDEVDVLQVAQPRVRDR